MPSSTKPTTSTVVRRADLPPRRPTPREPVQQAVRAANGQALIPVSAFIGSVAQLISAGVRSENTAKDGVSTMASYAALSLAVCSSSIIASRQIIEVVYLC